MEFIKEIIKGIFVGVANIIPGVSGGTMAVSMGVYDKLIDAISNIRKDFKGSVKTLMPFIIGAVIGIAVLSFVISFLFEKYPVPTSAAFIGLILGGIPSIMKNVKDQSLKYTHVISFTVLAAIIIFSSILTVKENAITEMTFSIQNILIMLGLGFLSAGTMIVPGVSGSMMLMMLGYYTFIINTIKIFISSALTFEIAPILTAMQSLIPFGIGMLLGIFIVSKTIAVLLKRYPLATYWGIIALVITSPFAIIIQLPLEGIGIGTIICSLIALVVGYIVAELVAKL